MRHKTMLVTRHPLQLSYVTTDIDEAIASYGRELGTYEFRRSEREMQVISDRGPLTIRLRLAMAFVGESMVEIIQPMSGDAEIFTDRLPKSGFGIAFHHFGYLVKPEVDWAEFREALDSRSVLFEAAGNPSFAYVDTNAALGHYLEYLHFTGDALEAWLESVPRND